MARQARPLAGPLPVPLLRRIEPALACVGAALLGALQTLAFVHTWAWWLPALTLAALVGGLGWGGPRRAACMGWSYGTAWLLAGVWWLFISLHRYGELAAELAVLAVFALCAALGLFMALVAALYARWRSGSPLRDAALFTSLWLLAEWGRGEIFTGFPWLASGYAQIDSPLAALAPWLGVYGVGAWMAFAAALLALAALSGAAWHRRLVWVAAAGGLFVLPSSWSSLSFSTDAGQISVALLQTNVKQDEKFAAEHMPQSLAWLAGQLQQSRAQLTVAPETAVPLLPVQLAELAPGYASALRRTFARPGSAALIGMPLGDFDSGYTNSVVGLSSAGEYRYDKTHLVPFGEFIPLGFRWFVDLMNIPLGDFARGPLRPPSFDFAGQRIAPNICYEDLFGEELARRFADGARAPTLFANLSNIAWFGDSIAVDQHLNISRFRALEFERPMIRATNTGATAIIDHRGRVRGQLAPHTQGVLQGAVQGREGLTPFAWWAARAGQWPLVAWALLTLVFVATRPAAAPRPGSGARGSVRR